MTHDQGERWDNRHPYEREKLRGRFGPILPSDHPCWTGPTNPQDAAACDRVMVALGTILAQRQFSNHYDTDAIYRAMRNVRKA